MSVSPISSFYSRFSAFCDANTENGVLPVAVSTLTTLATYFAISTKEDRADWPVIIGVTCGNASLVYLCNMLILRRLSPPSSPPLSGWQHV